MPNRRKKSFKEHRKRQIASGKITRLKRNEKPPKKT